MTVATSASANDCATCPLLREVGFSANRRLLAVQRLSHNRTVGADAIDALTDPTITDTGNRVPGLPFDSRRTQALLAALVIFRLQPGGFRNRDLRAHLAPLLGIPAQTMTPGQLSYDLRRLRHHGLVPAPASQSPWLRRSCYACPTRPAATVRAVA